MRKKVEQGNDEEVKEPVTEVPMVKIDRALKAVEDAIEALRTIRDQIEWAKNQ